MNIAHVNGLLNDVRLRLESLDEENLELQVGQGYENRPDRISAAKGRMEKLLAKLGANRSEANRIVAYGTKSAR